MMGSTTTTTTRDSSDPSSALTYTNPQSQSLSSSSSPITVSSDSFLNDPTTSSSHIGSASGSFQNDGLLTADTSGSNSDAEFGFSRPDFRSTQLVGTVDLYQRHVFLCYKNPQVWPPRIEAAEFDRLPRLLSAAVLARKSDMKKEIWFKRDEIELLALQGKVSVSPCSHIGGHKYAGNVIIFGPNVKGEVTGHWYGYVSPDDVSALLELHIGKGEIVDRLWRGQMGLSEEEQKESQYQRLQLNGETNVGKDISELVQTQRALSNNGAIISSGDIMSCCQEYGSTSCCQTPAIPEKKYSFEDANNEKSKKVVVVTDKKKSNRNLLSRMNSGKGSSTRRVCSMPTWLESWEREDTYAALAVACAALSVAVAYSCYKQSR
ncbi:hypothetical protein F8388_008200 [Cannabis sativa]|uniref:Uncharacterized protein n=1 Tax=Cannabis sativa TaxID=3483 RepID=A0A7J6H7L9_CANSA|nr:hypothetical protein F8388_008200 [Cannabis sativa]KAF4391282.1 hypothetical protein G4B88_016592 [Cannabis sativa]